MRLPFYFLLALITGSIWFGLRAADRCAPMPPAAMLRSAKLAGCIIRQQPYPDTYWYVRVYAENAAGKKWEKLYSARGPDEMKKAYQDCDAWLKCVHERAAELAKEQTP